MHKFYQSVPWKQINTLITENISSILTIVNPNVGESIACGYSKFVFCDIFFNCKGISQFCPPYKEKNPKNLGYIIINIALKKLKKTKFLNILETYMSSILNVGIHI